MNYSVHFCFLVHKAERKGVSEKQLWCVCKELGMMPVCIATEKISVALLH